MSKLLSTTLNGISIPALPSQTGNSGKYLTTSGSAASWQLITTVNKVAITAPATSAILTIADGKTFTANASITLGGTDSSIISVGGDVTFSGAFASTLTVTAATSVTLPTSGTLVGSNDTGSVTNTMLAGSIANAKLVNSSISINGSAISLGGSVTNLALTTGTLAQFAATSSSQLAGVMSSGGTGSGALVFATSPTLVTPTLGAASATSLSLTTALSVANGGTGATTLTGILKGTGTTAFVAATAGTDYSAGTSALGTGILKSTTSTGVLTIAVAADFPTLNQNTTGTAAGLSATLAVGSGGTGATTLTGILKGTGTTAFVAATSGTDYSAGTSALATGILKSTTSTGALTIAVAADFPTLNQNTTGTAAGLSATLAVGSGGTGSTTLTANNVLLGNGTSALQVVAPGTSGNVLTSNGTTWTSAAAPISLPTQTGNSGKYLTTDGTNASWGTVSGATVSIVNKSGAYTVVAGDLGKVINCTTGAFTVTLTAAATLGTGFTVTIWNTSTGSLSDYITIDPNASETINGYATWIVRRGEGLSIVCDGTNWQILNDRPKIGFAENNPGFKRPQALGNVSLALGNGIATANQSFAVSCSVGLDGYESNSGATYSSAIGQNSTGYGAVTATGLGSMALGGSYASGTDSFAAAITSNTSTYGATVANGIAIGYQAKVNSGTCGIAIGNSAISSSNGGLAISTGDGTFTATCSGAYSVAIGRSVSTSGQLSTAIGQGTVSANYAVGIGFAYSVTADMGVALGAYANTGGTIGKISFGSANGYSGKALGGKIILSTLTTNATATILTSDGAAASTTNQLILPNNSVFGFTGTITAMQQVAGGTDFAIWEVKGGIRRGASAATMTLGSYNINVLSKSSGATSWAIALSADTTNGCLAVTATGVASVNIRWVANIDTSEVIYA